MRRQVMKADYKGQIWSVVHDDSKVNNPFIVYNKWYLDGWHVRKMAEYADLKSCISLLYQQYYHS